MTRPLVGMQLASRVVALSREVYPDPLTALHACRLLLAESRDLARRGLRRPPVRIGDQWSLGVNFPRFPSAAFDGWMLERLNRQVPYRSGPDHVPIAVVAVTRRCPLACAHCSAAGELGAEETLDLDGLRAVMAALVRHGVRLVQLTGGEPMQRYDDVLQLVRELPEDVECAVATSGVGLDAERARALVEAGVSTVHVSLDDHRPDQHDTFRGRPHTWRAATRAAEAARDAGAVLVLALTLRPEMRNREDLEAYMALATRLGAHWVRWLEPQASGRLAGLEVGLAPAEIGLLEGFAESWNRRVGVSGPSIYYDSYDRRRLGCAASGDRGLYVDSAGNIRGCPFCADIAGRVGDDRGLDAAISRLRARGCPVIRPGAPRGSTDTAESGV